LLTKSRAVLGAGLAGAGAAFFLVVPQQYWWQCPIHAITGVYCPGCGGQRWFVSLLQGRLEDAWNYNQLLSISPIIFLALFLLKKLKVSGTVNTIAICLIGLCVLAFVVWRNLEPQVFALRS
jgi:hypothetical protein